MDDDEVDEKEELLEMMEGGGEFGDVIDGNR